MNPPEPENPNPRPDGAAKKPVDQPQEISSELERVIDSGYSPPNPNRAVSPGLAILGFFIFLPILVLLARAMEVAGVVLLFLAMLIGLGFGPRLRGLVLGMWICCGVSFLIFLALCGGMFRR